MKKIVALFALIMVLIAGCTLQAPPPQPTEAPPAVPTSVPAATEPLAPPTDVPAATATSAPTIEPTAVPPTATATQPAPAVILAYLDAVGNINIKNLTTGEVTAITSDASGDPSKPMIHYGVPRFSSNGAFLAFGRDESTPQADGSYSAVNNLVIYKLTDASQRLVLVEDWLAGYDWKPGSHLLSYTLGVATEYFVDSAHPGARGVYEIDADKNEDPTILVSPQGFTLMNPVWTPDGKYLYFEEVAAMEGAGNLARFDPETSTYTAYQKTVGSYDISPTEPKIAYDQLSYAPQGIETIRVSDLDLKTVQDLTQLDENGFQSRPRFSPDGKFIAYKTSVSLTGEADTTTKVFNVPVDGSAAPKEIYTGMQVFDLGWMPDGKSVLLFTGSYEQPSIRQVPLDGSAISDLVSGRDWDAIVK